MADEQGQTSPSKKRKRDEEDGGGTIDVDKEEGGTQGRKKVTRKLYDLLGKLIAERPWDDLPAKVFIVTSQQPWFVNVKSGDEVDDAGQPISYRLSVEKMKGVQLSTTNGGFDVSGESITYVDKDGQRAPPTDNHLENLERLGQLLESQGLAKQIVIAKK